jgi:hypothetical protein
MHQLPEIPLPQFEVLRRQGVPTSGVIQLRPYIPHNTDHALVIKIQLTFQLDSRTAKGEHPLEDLDKDDEELEADLVYESRSYVPEWMHDATAPLFDLTSFRSSNPARVFPRWYEKLEIQLSEYVNGFLLGERWRLESIETSVPEYLGGILVGSPVNPSAVELGYLHRRVCQYELWPQPARLPLDERE